MFSMDLYHVIRTIVESSMASQSSDFRQGHALTLSFDLMLVHYVKGSSSLNEYRRGARMTFLFNRPSDYGSVHTFCHEEEQPWEFLSSHDSCWIDAVKSELDNLYFRFAKEIIAEAGDDKLRPLDLRQHVHFSLFGRNAFKWVSVEITKDPNDKYSYRKLVKIVE